MILRFVAGWLLALAVLFLRWTCRVRLHDDPRPGLRQEKTVYAYAILHGHQLGAVLAAEAGTAAMAPLLCGPNEDAEVFRARVQESLRALERQYDAHEADLGVEAAARQRAKLARRSGN